MNNLRFEKELERAPAPRRRRLPNTATAACAMALAAGSAWAGPSCESLAGIVLENARVIASVTVPSTSFTGPDGRSYTDLPPFCKISTLATPAPDSSINIETWLPLEPRWNRRFEGIGNGGYAGTIAGAVPAMAAGLRNGFAVASTDMGTAPAVNSNADALIGHPQKWIDFGSRATHLMTTLSKQLIAAYYGSTPSYSYFNGCSTGGQQALMSAQRFPADYDGILAGAPAGNRTHIHTVAIWNFNAMHATPASLFTSQHTKLITDSVAAACAAKSGGAAGDTFLTDPRACDWDPGSLQCSLPTGTDCLTQDQVAAARKIYAGARNPATGRLIVPGSVRGAESDAQFGWVAQGKGAEPVYDSLFKWVFGPAWLAQTYDFDQHMALVDSLLASTLNANSADLSQFEARGGKLLAYHGTSDPLISPQESINYYLRVSRNQARNAAEGMKRTGKFFRLFMVPGMAHCAAGPGPNAFGNLFSGTVLAAAPPSNDAAHDAFVALQRWTEEGVAPEKLIATKYVQDQPALGIQMTRPLCPYPQFPRYAGTGQVNVAANFECVDNGNSGNLLNPEPAPEYLR